ncbi:PfkB family carbohydrate kinase, partial [Spirillospora sp. NPDC049652]
MSRGDAQMAHEVVVVGSVNADLVVRVDRRPGPGETVLGSDLATLPGGKGANQAVAAGRLGGRVGILARDRSLDHLVVLVEAQHAFRARVAEPG